MRKLIYISIIALTALGGCSAVTDKPATHTVLIKDMQFVPEEITVKKGDTIIWINQDMVAHDVTEEKTKAWTSSMLADGQSWKMAVNAEADYYCSIHVVMKGRIKLK